jgi:hypothetical protein
VPAVERSRPAAPGAAGEPSRSREPSDARAKPKPPVPSPDPAPLRARDAAHGARPPVRKKPIDPDDVSGPGE